MVSGLGLIFSGSEPRAVRAGVRNRRARRVGQGEHRRCGDRGARTAKALERALRQRDGQHGFDLELVATTPQLRLKVSKVARTGGMEGTSSS